MNLRQDKGYTYGARTSFDFRRRPGPFALQAGVHAAATVDAVRESLKEIADIRGERPVSESELVTSRAALTKGYPRNFETAEQVARSLAQIALYGLPDDTFERFVPAIDAVTAAQVTEVAVGHLRPDELHITVVGELASVAPRLGELGLGDPAIVSGLE
jgi:zinc protease